MMFGFTAAHLQQQKCFEGHVMLLAIYRQPEETLINIFLTKMLLNDSILLQHPQDTDLKHRTGVYFINMQPKPQTTVLFLPIHQTTQRCKPQSCSLGILLAVKTT